MSKKAFRPGGDARVLLDSARDDAPPPGGFERELARHGLEGTGALVAPAAKSAVTSLGAASGAEGAAKLGFPSQLLAVIGALGIAGAVVFELGFRHDSAPAKTTPPSSAVPPREGSIVSPHANPTSEKALLETAPPEKAPAEGEETVGSSGESAVPSMRPASTISVSDLPNAPVAARGSGSSSVSTARVVPSPAPEPSSGSLAEEIAALDRARAAIVRSPDEALALLDAHARQYPKTPFRAEAALVRVEALLSAGRRSEAENVAGPYLREQADAPVVRRMRRQLDAARTNEP